MFLNRGYLGDIKMEGLGHDFLWVLINVLSVRLRSIKGFRVLPLRFYPWFCVSV